jgi:hypothetical protein
MEHLIFGNDKDDNFYHSLTNEKFAANELSEKFEIFYNKYNNYENLPNLIVINKIDFPDLDQKIFGYKKIFTSNFFIVLEKD